MTIPAWTKKFYAQGSTPEDKPRVSGLSCHPRTSCTEGGGGESSVLIKCRAGKNFS